MVENQLMPSYVLNAEVLNPLLKVPHHLLATLEYKSLAYFDLALPLTHNQTISQPYIFTLMNQISEIEKIVFSFCEPFLSKNLFIFSKNKNGALEEHFNTGPRFFPITGRV